MANFRAVTVSACGICACILLAGVSSRTVYSQASSTQPSASQPSTSQAGASAQPAASPVTGRMSAEITGQVTSDGADQAAPPAAPQASVPVSTQPAKQASAQAAPQTAQLPAKQSSAQVAKQVSAQAPEQAAAQASAPAAPAAPAAPSPAPQQLASVAPESPAPAAAPAPAADPKSAGGDTGGGDTNSGGPNLTPLQTVEYINEKIVDQVRMPNGMDTGVTTVWPGYFAIEQSKGTLWWVRGAQTSESGWEIRYSSVQIDQLDPEFLTLGTGHGNYEKINIKCKATPGADSDNLCWHNWVASWDDQSAALSAGAFGDLKVARVANRQDQEVLNGSDVSVTPLSKQILLFDGKSKQTIDVEPTKPFSDLEVYLGAADSDTAQRVLRAMKYLVKTMPAAVTERDPFGP